VVFAVLIFSLQSSVLSQDKIKIVVIPKGRTTFFWKSVHTGVRLGAISLHGTEIIWSPPQNDDDIKQQISIVENCIKEGVSGIALAPADYEALAESVAKAANKKIPVLIFDSSLKGTAGKNFISYVSTDNRKAGKLAGDQLAKLVGMKGKVVLLRYVAGQASTKERENGFVEAISKYKNIHLIVIDRYAGSTVDEAKNTCMSNIDKLKGADGIFCPNEPSTMGMLLSLRSANLSGKIKFVGFDASTSLIEALKKGELDVLISQDPSRMGFFCVKTLVDCIHGKKYSLSIDTGVRMITCDNLNDPEIQKLLALPEVE
jgi:ribose transport system substrate-binding protein